MQTFRARALLGYEPKVKLADGIPELLEWVRQQQVGDIRHCVADISRARTLLGYEPKVKLADGIPELLEWVRQQQVGDTSKANTELEQHQLVR